jgi:hypothetical protein
MKPWALLILFSVPLVWSQVFSRNEHQNPSGQGQLTRPVEVANVCDLIPTQLKGIETPANSDAGLLWAQDYVGTELARRVVRGNAQARDVRMGTFDAEASLLFSPIDPTSFHTNFEGPIARPRYPHGTAVMSLTSSLPYVGASQRGKIVWFGYGSETSLESSFAAARPQIINASVGLIFNRLQEDSTRNLLRRLGEKLTSFANRSILVMASGNHFIEGEVAEKYDVVPAIKVGALSAWGSPTDFSEDGTDLTIYAPGADVALTAEGGPSSKSGTSFAAPLVAGALSNAVSFLPDLTTFQAKILLAESAVPLPISKHSKLHGAGMLNAYKLAKVAERLLGTPPEHLGAALHDARNYDFSRSAGEDLAQAQQLLKNAKKVSGEDGCAMQKKSLEKFRESFLLSSDGSDVFLKAAEALSKFYREAGLNKGAEFYESFLPGKLEPIIKKHLLAQSEDERIEALRYSTALENPGEVLFPLLKKSSSLSSRETTAAFFSAMEREDFLLKDIEGLLSDPSFPTDKLSAREVLWRMKTSAPKLFHYVVTEGVENNVPLGRTLLPLLDKKEILANVQSWLFKLSNSENEAMFSALVSCGDPSVVQQAIAIGVKHSDIKFRLFAAHYTGLYSDPSSRDTWISVARLLSDRPGVVDHAVESVRTLLRKIPEGSSIKLPKDIYQRINEKSHRFRDLMNRLQSE